MNYFLVSGPPDSGKTTQIFRLYQFYQRNGWSVKEFIQRANNDFQAVLFNVTDKREIIFHSDTDLKVCIDALLYYSKLHPKAETIITSCRNEPDPMRKLLFQTLDIMAIDNYHWELVTGRMPTGQHHLAAINWFQGTLEKTAVKIASLPPFNL